MSGQAAARRQVVSTQSSVWIPVTSLTMPRASSSAGAWFREKVRRGFADHRLTLGRRDRRVIGQPAPPGSRMARTAIVLNKDHRRLAARAR
jgi:hypothetical protein